MGSVGSPKSWTPDDAYRDCARGGCNVYCPQVCNYAPPLDPGNGSGTTFSPLIIVVICILGSAFLLVGCYAIFTKYCRRRGGRRNPSVEAEAGLVQVTHDQWQVTSSGLDEGLIKSITVFKYKKGDGLVEGTECSICLGEFQENENLKLLPKCCHAFHPPCIDKWLKSQANCPLCRADAAPVNVTLTPRPPRPPPPPAAPNPTPQISSALNISALEIRRQNDLVIVIGQEGMIDHQEQAENDVENPEIENEKIPDHDGSRQLRKSYSLGTFSTQRGPMVADVLQMNGDDNEETKVDIQQQLEMKVGSAIGIQEEGSKSVNGDRGSDSEFPIHP